MPLSLQCVAVCCSVLQCVEVCCSVWQFKESGDIDKLGSLLKFLPLALQRVAACCSVLQFVAVCCSALQCVAVCCSVWQFRESGDISATRVKFAGSHTYFPF